MNQRLGKHTIVFSEPPVIIGSAGVAGKKEGDGPLGGDFDTVFADTTLGQPSFEQAESAMLHDCILRAMNSAGKVPDDCDFVICGDLLNQCTGSAFALKDLNIPFLGMYGACSTMGLSLATAAMLVAGGAANTAVAATSSHFCSSERQFRFPLEYGGQRPPTSQWTVTGAGSAVVQNKGQGITIEAVHIGKITDLGITDINNMGAAMAPAAKRTIFDFLADTKTSPDEYDMILTGDLGFTGSSLLCELMKREENLEIAHKHADCGLLIFDLKKQDVNSGGSGCGCGGSVLCSHIMKRLRNGELKKIMFVATGALMSPTSCKQGYPIPGIAHGLILKGVTPQKKHMPTTEEGTI